MKKIFLFLTLSTALFAEEISGVWFVENNLPVVSIEFKKDVCIFNMKNNMKNKYQYNIDKEFIIINDFGYSFNIKNNKLILTPMFGENENIIELRRSQNVDAEEVCSERSWTESGSSGSDW